MKTVILANGEYPTRPAALRVLEEAETVICCDGASRHAERLLRLGRRCYLVGDGDSIDPRTREEKRELFHHDPDQETNDLTKAVKFCMSHGWREIAILGATGLREDHTLGNISLLADYMEQGMAAEMISDYGRFIPIQGSHRFASWEGQQVSLFSLTPEEPITVRGLAYPIERRCLRRWWEGTLNEALGESFEVEAGEKGIVIVYLAEREG